MAGLNDSRLPVKDRLIIERDRLLKEAEALRHKVSGIDLAIDLLRDEADRAPRA
jgi:hypothetical protein